MVDPGAKVKDVDDESAAELARLAAAIGEVAGRGPAVPGTLVHRLTRCGRPGCRCGADPPQLHGPYWSWTRKVAGKTRTRYLSEELAGDYRPAFDNAKDLRTLVAELEALSLRLLESDPRWDETRPAKPSG